MDTSSYNADLANCQRGEQLGEFLAREQPDLTAPTGADRLRIVETILHVIEGTYCHLPQKRAAYASNPVQALRLLRGRAVDLSNSEFHLAIASIVTGLRDAHTLYSGPRERQRHVAVLPFLVEQYGPPDRPEFLVSKVSAPELIGDPRFEQGVRLTSWNGIPFTRAVDVYADRETGGRQDARRARALESLTFRGLRHGPPPDEMRVVVGFVPLKNGHDDPDGVPVEITMDWRVVTPREAPTATGNAPGSRASRYMGVDPGAEQVRRAKKLLFSGELWHDEESRAPKARGPKWLETTMQDVLAARVLDDGKTGYVRIWSFDVEDDDAFVAELSRLLRQLPQTGLILDLRGNPGGLIWAAERALQLFTPNRIVPTRFSLVANEVTTAMAGSPFNRLELEAWLPSLESAISTGEQYSQPLPLTDPEWCNDIGQRYGGPVVCVVDPNTYSAGDLFAAGFVDNQIGPLVSVGEATGGGGANVWTNFDVSDALADTPFELQSLPKGVGYSLAIRRAIRSGPSDGIPIEDMGVSGLRYSMTRRDLLEGNQDLTAFCTKLLSNVQQSAMDVAIDDGALRVTTSGLNQLETYLDGRPLERVREITNGVHVVPRPAEGLIEFVGRRGDTICQRRRELLKAASHAAVEQRAEPGAGTKVPAVAVPSASRSAKPRAANRQSPRAAR